LQESALDTYVGTKEEKKAVRRHCPLAAPESLAYVRYASKCRLTWTTMLWRREQQTLIA
jgi:hypothetical protein